MEFVCVLTGTSDDLTAKVLIENSTAVYYNGLARQSILIEPDWVDETSGEGQWNATVRYGVRPPIEVGESSFAFDTSGGAQHITQSLATIACPERVPSQSALGRCLRGRPLVACVAREPPRGGLRSSVLPV